MTSVSVPVKDRYITFKISLTHGWKFRSPAEANQWLSKFFCKLFSDHPEIAPEQIRKITPNGVILKSGKIIGSPDLISLPSSSLDAEQKSRIIWETLPIYAKPLRYAINQKKINTPEKLEVTPNIARAEFSTIEDLNVLDQIPTTPRWNQDSILPKEKLVELEARYLLEQARHERKISQAVEEETRIGVALGAEERKNYRVTVLLDHLLKTFFKRDQFQSDEILAKNSPLNGTMTRHGMIKNAITSSFNRVADTISLLRKVSAADGSSDCYAGRVDNLKKAKEMAQFIFLGEIDAFEKQNGASKGIRKNPDGSYQLTFAVQSLLTMSRIIGADQKKRFYQEKAAYQQLISETTDHPLEIRHPVTGKVYLVRMNPQFSLAANQFNFSNRIEGLGFGKKTAKKESDEADAVLFKLAEEKIQELSDQTKIQQIRQAIASLRKEHLQPYQIIMARSYLCHLLEIPQVIHCLSSVDRTGGVAIPMVVAMKQWLRSDAPIPEHIYDIAHTPLPTQPAICPFQYLFYYKMLHELKISQLSRGKKGFKIDEIGPLHLVHPACLHLMPPEFIKKGIFKKSWNAPRGKIGAHHILYTGNDSSG
jgi:hypothetical protein